MLEFIGRYFKSIVRFSTVGAKLFSIGITAKGLKQIWEKKEDAQEVAEYSLTDKIKRSAFYALHLGSITLTTLVLFDLAPVSAPVATAVVSTSALLKGIADLVADRLKNYSLKRKISLLNNQLATSHIDFQRNVTLMEDLKELRQGISQLQEQANDLKRYIQQLNRIKETQPNKAWDEIKVTFNQLQSASQERVNKNNIIAQFFKKIDFSTTTIEQVIKSIESETVEHHIQKEALKKSFNEKNKETKRTSQTELDREVAGIEQQMAKLGILSHQCIKYKKTQDSIKKIQAQLKEMVARNSASLAPKAQYALEKEYLEEKIAILQHKLQQLSAFSSQATSRMEIEISEMRFDKLKEKGFKTSKAWLVRNMRDQVRLLESYIKGKESEYRVKQKYFKFFSDQDKTVIDDFSTAFQLTKMLIDAQNDLAIAEHDEASRKKSVDFSTIISSVALLMCFVPDDAAHILHSSMLSLGVMAGTTSLWDMYGKRRLSSKLSQKEVKQWQGLIKEKQYQIATVNDPDVQRQLHDRLQEILDTSSSPTPESVEVEVPRKAKLQAKIAIQQRSNLKKQALPGQSRILKKRY